MLGQRLVVTIVEGISIDTTSGREHTEWIEPDTFPKDIALFAGTKEQRAEEAWIHANRLDKISFWTDVSRMDTWCTGASVAWRDPE